jgi:alpha-galactosidase
VTAKWSDLGITGRQPVRDLWRRRNIGSRDESYSVTVPRHGAVFVKIGKADRTDWQ